MIQKHEGQHTIRLMCGALSVSRSGYNHWKHRKPSQRTQDNQQLDPQVFALFHAEKNRAGAPRIVRSLRKEGVVAQKNAARCNRSLGSR